MNEALRLLRVYYDMKANELSRRLGISASYLSEIEKGKRRVNMELIEKYAKVFHVRPSAIMVFAESLDRKGKTFKDRIGRKIFEVLSEVEKEGTENLSS